MELVAVAAVADNGVIGRDGELPWPSIPADKRQYRSRIASSPVILGRRTFESMRDDLPGTVQIVISRSERSFEEASAVVATSVEEARDIVDAHGADRGYVIGGAGIYALFHPDVDRMILSRIPEAYDGDAYYPDWDESSWERVEVTEYDDFTREEWVRL